ncbi:hypothetical protein HMPREF3181_00002 [Parvimonas sp. KA00067]|nr:hypothetical protein HMPREF3181_00002 [Parvimonas sp. KA00067]
MKSGVASTVFGNPNTKKLKFFIWLGFHPKTRLFIKTKKKTK